MAQIITRAAQRTANYYPYDAGWSVRLATLGFPALDQVIVGVYHDGAISLVFMEERMFYAGSDHRWISIDYGEIRSVKLKEQTKEVASTLIVAHGDTSTELSIEHANGKLRDIFPLMHVLSRIVQKVARSQEPR